MELSLYFVSWSGLMYMCHLFLSVKTGELVSINSICVCWMSKSLWSCLLDSSECLRVLPVLKIRAAGSDTWHGQRRCRALLLCLLCRSQSHVEKPGSSHAYHQYSPMWSNTVLPFSYSGFLSLTWRSLAYEPLLAENSLELCLSDYFRTVACHCFDNAVELLLICVCLVATLIHASVLWKVSIFLKVRILSLFIVNKSEPWWKTHVVLKSLMLTLF